MYELSKKADKQKTEKALKRRANILGALFEQRRKTRLLLDFYAAVLAELKEFAVIFQVDKIFNCIDTSETSY